MPPHKDCTYAGCENDQEKTVLHPIVEGMLAGGQHWGPLVGSVLCDECFERYKEFGTLGQRPPNYEAKRCTHEACEKPHLGTKFIVVKADQTQGGHDWSPLAGKVLCRNCYQQFLKRGTLERNVRVIEPAARKCTNEDCDRPFHGRSFYQIEEGRMSGGQNWAGLVGMVLCHACYARFMRSGDLRRQRRLPTKRPKHSGNNQGESESAKQDNMEMIMKSRRLEPPPRNDAVADGAPGTVGGVKPEAGAPPAKKAKEAWEQFPQSYTGALDMLVAVCAKEGMKSST